MRGWRTGQARGTAALAWLLAAAPRLGEAYTLDVTSTDSVKSVASSMAADMMSFYHGHQPGGTPGLLPQPYYWWEAGALMGALIDYWYYTGDTTYNNITEHGLLFQVGPNKDYMPPNQTLTEGNDDQGFWGMAAMTAAEYNFQDPPAGKPQWLALAQAVFNTQAARWDSAGCGGGLRWQIFQWNKGFDYKNSISQACFFNLAARLARFTGNQTYADWADRTWDWMISAKFIDPKSYYIYDGAHIENCSQIEPYQWTYNAGAFLLGAAAMYSFTNGTSRQEVWRERVDGLINGTQVFFAGNDSSIMSEVACEPVNLCDFDQQSFKAYLARWMAATTKWAPFTHDRVMPWLQASAVAAAAQCTGGENGRMCGLRWTDGGKWDGSTGVGQQMAAMEVVLANMIKMVRTPVTNSTGGTSAGDPGAGGVDVGLTDPSSILHALRPMTAGDRAGAAMCTIVVLLACVAGIIFVLLDEASDDDESSSGRLAGMGSSAAGGRAAVLRKLGGRPSREAKEMNMVQTDSDPSIGHPRPSAEKAVVVEETQQSVRAKDLAAEWTVAGARKPSAGPNKPGDSASPLPPKRPSKSVLSQHQRHEKRLQTSGMPRHRAGDENVAAQKKQSAGTAGDETTHMTRGRDAHA